MSKSPVNEQPAVDEQVEPDRNLATKMLGTYFDARKQQQAATHSMGIVGKPIKECLEAYPGEVLWDGERRLEGYLQQRNGTPVLDAANLPSALLAFLAQHGCLKLDNDVFKALDKGQKFPECVQVKSYIMPGPGSVALQVKEK